MKSRIFNLLILFIAMSFASFVSAEPQAVNHPINKWMVKGRLGIQTTKGGETATFNWLQTKDHYILQIIAPLGAGSAKIIGQPGKVILQTTNPPQTRSASSPERLLMRNLGWALPISDLFYWIQGLPAPTSAAKIKYNNDKTIEQIVQQGWVINYLAYARLPKISLPIRIVITHAKFRVKILINMWKT